MSRRILATFLRLRTSERGEVYVEYVVLGALAVLVILSAVQYFFGAVSGLFQRIGDSLGGL
ncbi:MAG: Flp family type IVb pilin [Gemmatimonadales bacterium]